MSQLTLTQIRDALATYLAANVTNADGSALQTVTTRFGQVNPPVAIVVPAEGTFASYKVSMDGQADWTLRVIMVASMADAEFGQDILDPYLAPAGSQSIAAAIAADETLGGTLDGFAQAMEATGYGVNNIAGIDYLAASVVVQIGD